MPITMEGVVTKKRTDSNSLGGIKGFLDRNFPFLKDFDLGS